MELLELYLSPLEEATKFKVIVTQSPAGEGETESSLPFIDADRDWRVTIMRTLGVSSFLPWSFLTEGEQDWMVAAGVLGSDRSSFRNDYLVNIGRSLYRSLFPQGSRVEKLLQQSIGLAESKSSKLVVRLKFEEDVVRRSRLADYPWELLHEGGFLCHHQVEFSRYIAYGAVPPNLPTADKLNVLLVSSAASDEELNLNPLSGEEKKAVRRGLETARDRGDIFLEQLPKATMDDLRAYLAEHPGDKAPHVLHFDGHGLFGKRCPNPKCRAMNAGPNAEQCRKCNRELPPPQGYLVFEDKDGDADYISAQELGTLLQQSGLSDGSGQTGGVALVVLSACQSGMAIAGESVFNGAAQKLIAHRVPAVVAMQYSVRIDSATKFAEQFYRSLGQKNSLAVAVSQGREAMGVEGNQWYRPVLYLRWQDNEGGQLFGSATSPERISKNLFGTDTKILQEEEFLRDFAQSLFPKKVNGDVEEYRCFFRLRFHRQNYRLENQRKRGYENTEIHQECEDIAALMKSHGFAHSDIQSSQKIVIAEIVNRYKWEIECDKGQTGSWQEVYKWLWDGKFPRWKLDRLYWEPLKKKVDDLDWIKIVPDTIKNVEVLELPEPEPLQLQKPYWISIQLPPEYPYLLLLNRALTMRCFFCPSYVFAPQDLAAGNRMILPQTESPWYQKRKSGIKFNTLGSEEFIAIALKEALDFDWLKPKKTEMVIDWRSDRLTQLWQWLEDNPNSWQGCYQKFKVVDA